MEHHESIIARRNSVERISIRAGYPKYRSEDLAQSAALSYLENQNLKSQSSKQAFVDAVRGGIERTYDRRGNIVVPIFESQFEDYPSFINAFRSKTDLESEQIRSSDLYDIRSALSALPERSKLIFEGYYYGGKTLVEMARKIGITESRIMQILNFSRERIKEEVIQSRLSQQKSRRRKFEESRALPREIQTRSEISRAIEIKLAEISEFAGFNMESFKVPKIPQEIFRSF